MITYVVRMDGLEEIERALGMVKDKSKYVLRAAINETAKEVEKKMVAEAKNRYDVKGGKRSFKQINKIKKARVSNLVAIIEARDKSSELVDYKVSPPTYFPGSKGAPKWISAKVLRQNRLRHMALLPGNSGDKYKGFVVRYKSGHIAFANRVPGSTMREKNKEKIESLYSMPKPNAEGVAYGLEVDPDVYDILARNIQQQIDRFLG